VLVSRLNWLESEKSKLYTELGMVRAENEALSSEVEALKDELSSVLAQHEQRLRRATELEQEMAVLKDELSSVLAEHEQGLHRATELEQEAARNREAIRQKDRDLSAIFRTLEKERQRVSEACDEIRGQFMRSTSWRITSPLRWLAMLMRSLRRHSARNIKQDS